MENGDDNPNGNMENGGVQNGQNGGGLVDEDVYVDIESLENGFDAEEIPAVGIEEDNAEGENADPDEEDEPVEDADPDEEEQVGDAVIGAAEPEEEHQVEDQNAPQVVNVVGAEPAAVEEEAPPAPAVGAAVAVADGFSAGVDHAVYG